MSAVTRTGAGRATSATRGFSLPVALAACAVLLLTAVVWLARPAGDMQGAATQSIAVTGVAGAIQEGTRVVQPVLATEDGLTGFMATFGTYGGVTDCAVQVTVTDPDGRTLSDEAVPCGELIDSSNASQVAQFPKQPDSAGKTYTVTYTGAEGDWDQAVTMWVGTPTGVTLPATAEGRAAEVLEVFEESTATATVAEYAAPSVWDQVWRAAGLAGIGGPWWAQPVALAIWAAAFAVALVGSLAAGARRRAGLVLLVALALFRGLLWASVMPPLEGMDEGAHISYAQFMAEEGRIPVRDQAYDGLPNPYSEQLDVLDQYQHRGALPPGDRPSYLDEDVEDVRTDLLAASPRASGSSPAAGYPPVYYLPAAVAYDLTPGTFEAKIYSMRLWSIVLGCLGAWATLAVARRLFPGRSLTPMLLAVAVTVQPMIAHQYAIVNNDGLVITAGIAALAAALRMANGHVRWRDGLFAGACVGMALLAKPYGAGALPVVGVGLILGAVAAAPRLRRFLVGGTGVAVGLVATYGIWVVAQRVLGFPSTALPVYSDGDQSRGLRHYIGLQVQDGLASMRWRWGEQLFGSFAWLDVHLPQWAYDAVWRGLRLTVLLVVLWGGWQAVLLVRRLRRRPEDAPDDAEPAEAPRTLAATGPAGVAPDSRAPVGPTAPSTDGSRTDESSAAQLGNFTRTGLALLALGGLMAVLYAAGYLYFRSAGRDELLQGRYALMALPALLALPSLTLEGFTERLGARWRRLLPLAAMAGVALAMWTLHVVGLAAIADRFYL